MIESFIDFIFMHKFKIIIISHSEALEMILSLDTPDSEDLTDEK